MTYVRAETALPIPDPPFYQDTHKSYLLSTPAENDVRAITLDAAGRLWAATGDGVRCLDNGQWTTPKGGAGLGPTYAIYRDPQGNLWAGAWNGLYRVTVAGVTPTEVAGSPIEAINARRDASEGDETLFAAGPHGIWCGDTHGAWRKIAGRWQTVIRAILPTSDDRLWIGTASGLYLQSLSGPK